MNYVFLALAAYTLYVGEHGLSILFAIVAAAGFFTDIKNAQNK